MTRLRSEDGVTLPETLVAMAAGIVILGTVLTFIFVASQQHDRTVNRVTALDESTIGFERVQRDLRQALELDPSPTSATPVTTGVLRARLWVKSGSAYAQHWIRFDCTTVANSCTRRDETAGTAAKTIVTGLVASSGATAFTVTRATAPAVLPTVGITFTKTVSGATNPIRLTSTVAPRNCEDGLPSGSTVCPG